MLVRVFDLQRKGNIDWFACATAVTVCRSSVRRGIFRPKIKLFPIKIVILFILEYTKKSVKQSDIANTKRFWYILQIFSGLAKLGRNRQNSDISLSDITKFDCIPPTPYYRPSFVSTVCLRISNLFPYLPNRPSTPSTSYCATVDPLYKNSIGSQKSII
jgi:hypothetical protein